MPNNTNYFYNEHIDGDQWTPQYDTTDPNIGGVNYDIEIQEYTTPVTITAQTSVDGGTWTDLMVHSFSANGKDSGSGTSDGYFRWKVEGSDFRLIINATPIPGGGGSGSGNVEVEVGTPIGTDLYLNSFDGTTYTIGAQDFPDALLTFTNTAGIHEIGQTVDNFSLNWSYNEGDQDPASQTIDHSIGSLGVAIRTYAVTGAGLTTNETYRIDAVGNDANTSFKTTTITFQNRVYYGVNDTDITTDTDVLGILAPQNNPFSTGRQRTIVYDASVGGPNYLFYAYPVSFGLPASTEFNGFVFTDYTVTTINNFTNASGGVSDYYILRTNNQYNGSGLEWKIN